MLTDPTGRLHRLLRSYQRDQVLLCVRQVVPLARQPTQVVLQAVIGGCAGDLLRDAGGAARLHTFEVSSVALGLEVGQCLRVAEEASGLRIEVLPAAEARAAPLP